MKNLASIILLCMLPLCLVACDWYPTEEEWGAYVKEVIESEVDLSKVDSTYTSGEKAAAHAYKQTVQNTLYDGSWVNIGYPGGDPGYQQGVCTDVVIRTYRKMGIDLQKEVHMDMKQNFSLYPNIWGLKRTDTNIDHRRVPNLMTFFKHHHAEKPITTNPKDYLPGDVVSWNLGGAITHIGIVVHKKSTDGKRNLIVHNIGSGQVIEDALFAYTIIGHYRYKK